MDKLKSLLAAKKPQSKVTIQKQQLQKQRQQQQKKQKQLKQKQQQQKQRRLQQIDEFYAHQYGKKKIKLDQVQKMIIPFTQQQIKQKLRQLYQPQTLQNQTQQSRYKRLLKFQKIHKQYPQIDMKKFDMQFYKKLKEKQYFDNLNNKYHDRMIEPKLTQNLQYRNKKIKQIYQQKDKDHYAQQNFAQICDQIYLWLIKIFKEWKERQDNKYSKQDNAKNNDKILRYEETYKQIQSFMKVLKNRAGNRQMIISVYNIVNCCLVREYVQANDKYLDLSIGKAPWPLGVAMLSITVKRNAHKLSHVLNDDTTRRWMQGIKRLITLSQQLYPNQQNTKMVLLTVNSMI